MATYEPNLVVDISTGRVTRVPLTPAEAAARDALTAAYALLPLPVDPVTDVVQQVLDAPDFDMAKRNLAAYIAKRKAA